MKLFFLLSIFLISFSGLAQEDDEKVLNDLEAERRKQIEKAVEADLAAQKMKEQTLQVADKLKEIPKEGLEQIDLMSEKSREMVKDLLKTADLGKLPRDLIKEMITAKVKGKFFGRFLEMFPVVLEIFVDVVQSKEAIPGLLDLLGKSDDLKTYFYYCIALFILGILIRKFFFSKDWGLFRKIVMRLSLSLVLSITSLMIFYSMFELEFGPTWKIIKSHF